MAVSEFLFWQRLRPFVSKVLNLRHGLQPQPEIQPPDPGSWDLDATTTLEGDQVVASLAVAVDCA